jgi:hypothetical protein
MRRVYRGYRAEIGRAMFHGWIHFVDGCPTQQSPTAPPLLQQVQPQQSPTAAPHYSISKRYVAHTRIEFRIALGLTFVNGHEICYVISPVQIFYHMDDLRNLLVKITDPVDRAFGLGHLLMCMEDGESCCMEQLRNIQTSLNMSSNDDAVDAFRKLLQQIMQSGQPSITSLIQESLFFKEIIMEGANPANITNEIDN